MLMTPAAPELELAGGQRDNSLEGEHITVASVLLFIVLIRAVEELSRTV